MKTRFVTGLVISALVHAGLFGTSLLGRKATGPDPEPPPERPRPDHIFLDPVEPDPVITPDAPAPDVPPPRPAPQAPERPETPDPRRLTQDVQRPLPPGDLTLRNVTHIPPGPIGTPAAGPGIIDVSLLKQKPAPRAQVAPAYPFDLRHAGIEGEVVVEFIVDTAGRVQNAFVVRSTHRGFEAAALQAIGQWRFSPGRQDGRAVNTGRVQQLFTFTLNQ
ncbi:MAG: energy transducer TonB [Opitutaceae bacterium]|nr:energy transducer TonB [Opitutaceae bacterium]